MKILVTGGTGFLGAALIDKLIARKHEVILTTRRPVYGQRTSTYQIIHWPLKHERDLEIARECVCIINLAGAPIFGSRWGQKQKELIRSSRVQFTRDLVDAVATSPQLKIFLSASAVGFYGDRKSEVLTEDSPRGEGFLAEICRAWEGEANTLAGKSGIRVVNLRTGVVLARHGGFLKASERIYRLHLGGPVGSGEQFISWIHLQDWLNAVLLILEKSDLSGPVNLVAPEPVTNRAFSYLFRTFLGAPLQLPLPQFAARLGLCEQASLLLDSQNARPKILLDNDFRFNFSALREALSDLYSEELL